MNLGDEDAAAATPPAPDMDAADPPTQRTLPVHALPSGTRIRDYQITGLLGEGGFGIVYLATDVMLERAVAVKEYLPSSIAGRAAGTLNVTVRVPREQDTFDLGMKSFVNEARLLARFDHPALLKVLRFWEENGTAYMAMPFYEGRTLQRVFERLGRPPTEVELRAWLWPLLDALQVLHAAQCFHRDIAPDNILITASGPLLLDFGAARRVIGDAQRTLTVVLKPGFAPIEQYGESGDLHQGAWTDIYALGGVLYAAITGRRPVPAVGRLMEDHLLRVRESAAGRYSLPFLQAIDMALALRPQDRPQSIGEFRALLDGQVAARLLPVAPPMQEARIDDGVDLLVDFPDAAPAPAPAPARAPAPAPAPAPPAAQNKPAHRPPVRVLAPPVAPAPQGRRISALPFLIIALVLALGVFGWLLWGGAVDAVPDPVPTPVAPVPVQQPVAPTALPPVTSPEPVSIPASAATTAPEPSAAASATETAAVPAPEPQPEVAVPAPVVQEAPPTAAAPPRRTLPRTTVMPQPPPQTTADSATRRARCSDILAKGSLETLTAAETAYLKKECK